MELQVPFLMDGDDKDYYDKPTNPRGKLYLAVEGQNSALSYPIKPKKGSK
jgi:hypothetical protein